MEMVAASKMRRAVAAVLAIRPYAHSAWNILTNLAEAFERYRTGLLAVREVKKILMIVVTPNRGLCGGFNSQLMKKVIEQVKNPGSLKINRVGNQRIESKTPDEEIVIDFVTIGKKGASAVRKLGKNIIATFDDLSYLPKAEDVRPLARLVKGYLPWILLLLMERVILSSKQQDKGSPLQPKTLINCKLTRWIQLTMETVMPQETVNNRRRKRNKNSTLLII